MKIKLNKLLVLKKLRHWFNCPACEAIIVIDDEVFDVKPDNLVCYKCQKEWIVLQIDNQKDGTILVDMMKGSA